MKKIVQKSLLLLSVVGFSSAATSGVFLCGGTTKVGGVMLMLFVLGRAEQLSVDG